MKIYFHYRYFFPLIQYKILDRFYSPVYNIESDRLEKYRSGHNEPHSKCGCPPGHVGSNPTFSASLNNSITSWGCSSAGRARDSHLRGQGFESPHLHHFWENNLVSAKFFCGKMTWPQPGLSFSFCIRSLWYWCNFFVLSERKIFLEMIWRSAKSCTVFRSLILYCRRLWGEHKIDTDVTSNSRITRGLTKGSAPPKIVPPLFSSFLGDSNYFMRSIKEIMDRNKRTVPEFLNADIFPENRQVLLKK